MSRWTVFTHRSLLSKETIGCAALSAHRPYARRSRNGTPQSGKFARAGPLRTYFGADAKSPSRREPSVPIRRSGGRLDFDANVSTLNESWTGTTAPALENPTAHPHTWTNRRTGGAGRWFHTGSSGGDIRGTRVDRPNTRRRPGCCRCMTAAPRTRSTRLATTLSRFPGTRSMKPDSTASPKPGTSTS